MSATPPPAMSCVMPNKLELIRFGAELAENASSASVAEDLNWF